MHEGNYSSTGVLAINVHLYCSYQLTNPVATYQYKHTIAKHV